MTMIDEKSSYFCVEEKTSRKRHYEPSNLLNDLVKRRKLELDNNEQPTPMENPQSDRLTEACEKNDDAIKKKASLKAEQRTVKLNGKGFSITGAVSDLIDLNSGTANVKIERDLDFQRLKEKEISICNKDEMKCEQKPWHASLISLAMPSPDIPLASNRQSFILSLSVFKQRQLIRHIREHLPQARLVERAFNSDTALSKEQKAMTQDDNTNEANILISSNTGLIWTTLQKIKQRSLPGQKAQSPTKEKLKMLSAKYENLIILISKNNISNKESESHCVLDESDCEAMADIHGFGAQLDCHLTVYFVPGEGTDLFKWITAVMGKYGIFNEGSVNLLEDESMVNLFHGLMSLSRTWLMNRYKVGTLSPLCWAERIRCSRCSTPCQATT